MSIISDFPTGDTGTIRLVDYTDDDKNRTVVIWVRSLSPVSGATLIWRTAIDGNLTYWTTTPFKNTTTWQKLGVIYVGYGQEFFFRLEDTLTTQLRGPTECTIQLSGGVSKATIKVGTSYKQAIPYVRVDGVWKLANAWIMANGQWQEAQ